RFAQGRWRILVNPPWSSRPFFNFLFNRRGFNQSGLKPFGDAACSSLSGSLCPVDRERIIGRHFRPATPLQEKLIEPIKKQTAPRISHPRCCFDVALLA
ncbi:hypothetical protein, partial [Ferrimonas gelatinilytica]|uniref:hypothetical protein n=1 Tax=Ferrimonas gelatinilytica TaxID=1255257 RepID=UPI0031EF14F8